MPASISADGFDNLSARESRARSPSRPLSWRNAWRRWRSVSAWIRSSRPSASVRSSLPFSKPRRVNSPSSAGRTFSNVASAAKKAASTARPPWIWNSATSSPVAEAGPGNHKTTASSMGSPDASAEQRACRQARGGKRFSSQGRPQAPPASGPDTRTMAIAVGGRPEDRAKMV